MKYLLQFAVLVASMAASADRVEAARDGSSDASAPKSAVRQLIGELGSDQYAVRRRAEEQLLRLGPEAFDDLKQAENNADLEIAERVRYIVQRMRVEWIRPEDGAEVRRALARYGDLSDAEKRERIRQLAELPDGAGLPALCRIARFEPSPLVARRAALAVVDSDEKSGDLASRAAACQQELGASERAPVEWIQLRLREIDEPRATIEEWAWAARAEAALLAARSPETDFGIVRELLRGNLDRCHNLKLRDETTAALAAIVELIANQLKGARDPQFRNEPTEALIGLARWGVDYKEKDPNVAGLVWGLAWIIREERWDVLADFEQKFESQLQDNRKLLYHLAAAQSRAGETDRAGKLAERAFQLKVKDDKPELKAKDDEARVALADVVAELGFVEWAEREYRRAIDAAFPVLDKNSVEARSDLAMWLHDREDYREAADLLGELVDAAADDRDGRKKLIRQLNDDGSNGQEVLAGVAARREFYMACHEQSQGDFKKQREHLDTAVKAYDKDPDILIAMYRLQEADEDFRQKTRERIRAASAYQQQLIDEYPDIPTLYNQWAWLISNTEGDQAKAVEYSRRSLELSPNEPSYLDTLGRCYFAVGDLENAVKYQRRAVKRAPQYRVMRRQLKQFEDALAAKPK